MNALERTFGGRVLGVASMHHKERALGPQLAAPLALREVRVIEGLDTDRFGAFSGERARELAPRDAALAKARAGASASGMDLVIASEGSFFPHPLAPLASCDEEWLVLLDQRSERCYAHRYVTFDVAHAGRVCRSLDELREFCARAPFPSHQLVLRPQQDGSAAAEIFKGLSDRDELEARFALLHARHGAAWVELDLRAHANPTRMRAIQTAAREFAAELARLCPRCSAPHFAIARQIPGLPCAQCGEPTASLLAQVRRCEPCGAEQREERADGRREEDPGACEACNP